MIELLVILTVVLFGAAVWKSNKIYKDWGKSTSSVLDKVVNVVSPSDPVKKLKEQIKVYKLKLKDLQVNTQTIEVALKDQEDLKERASRVAKLARDAGSKSEALEAFNMVKLAEKSIESLGADLTANNELYDKMTSSLSGRQMQLTKFEAQQKRNEMRSAANSIRRDIAQDEMLEEGLFAPDLADETCQEELEAIAIEKINKDLKGGDVLDRYEEGKVVDDEFEAFFSEGKDNG